MNALIDREPIYFACGGRSYLLEARKGQYGIAAGAEIGLYVSDETDEEHPERLLYESVADADAPELSFVLKRERERLVSAHGKTSRLTGFAPGEYADRRELVMVAAAVFSSRDMSLSFYRALYEAGYDMEEIRILGPRVEFRFGTPKAAQQRIVWWRVKWAQWTDRRNCRRYKRQVHSQNIFAFGDRNTGRLMVK